MDDELKTFHNKRGYLNDDFLLFHLKDCKGEQYEYHYHDFYKIIFFISGKVTYLIEGKTYSLKPWDILLITNRDIHKAIIETSEAYERIIIWFDPKFLEKNNSSHSDLLTCFNNAIRENHNLLRVDPEKLKQIKYYLSELEAAFKQEANFKKSISKQETNTKSNLFGIDIIKNSLFLLLVIYLNKLFLQLEPSSHMNKTQYDETISKIVNYINDNIDKDLAIESLSEKFYLSKYTLMHKFKRQTGFTVHNFILQKRLLMAGIYIKNGRPVMEASYECGFDDYSSFVRAFKKFYRVSPREYGKVKE